MPTYCIPDLSSVPGFSGQFDWWALPPDPTNLRFSPDNPNWLGAFSLSEGAGANRDMQFRALKGTIAGQPYLFLSWVIRVSALDTNIDHANVLLSDGANYVAVQIKAINTASTNAGTQNNGIYSYRMHNCTVSGTTISLVNPSIASDGANIETTGRMWVDVTSPGRGLQTRWAFQVAIPLGVAWAPSSLSLPVSGAFKLWYEVWTSVPNAAVPYQVPTTPAGVHTTGALQIIPTGLDVAHLLDMSTGGGCADAVTISYNNVGVRNVDAADPPRSSQYSIRLDLGQDYPPNKANPANGGTLYSELYTPNVSDSRFRNQFFAIPTFPTDLLGADDPMNPKQAKRESMRARFSLANWGSQYSDPTANSWRPIPGGEDTQYLDSNGEARFVWPNSPVDSYTSTLVRNINKYLNHVWNNTLATVPSAQNQHQCLLVELSSTRNDVIITRSSIYVNMNVTRASIVREPARISIEGLLPISSGPRDVYLYLQTFNMPKLAKGEDKERARETFGIPRSLITTKGHDETNVRRFEEVEDIAAFYPTYIVHVYHDTGNLMELENGSKVPILRPQTAFGYFVSHEGDLHGWETRIYGAEKITENFYRLRVPNDGAQYVETAIQARESANEEPLPPDGLPSVSCEALAAWLDTKGLIGRLLARFVRLICRLLGKWWWTLFIVIFLVVLLIL